MFCPNCGKEVEDDAVVVEKVKSATEKGSDKSRGMALILSCIGFVAIAGLHRFYVGKIGTGILWLLTGGLFGIGTIVDVVMICAGSFTDNNGETLLDWDLD